MQPLNLDLNNVDTTPDRLQKGKVKVAVKEASFVESKNKPGNYNLALVFTTVLPEVSSKGGTINPGYQLRSYLPVQQSENEKAPDFKVALAKVLDAVLGERPQLNEETLKSFIGRELYLKVNLKEDDTYGWTNEVKDFEAVSE